MAYWVQIRRKDETVKRVSNLTFSRTPKISEKLLVHINGALVKCEVTAVHCSPLCGEHEIDAVEI